MKYQNIDAPTHAQASNYNDNTLYNTFDTLNGKTVLHSQLVCMYFSCRDCISFSSCPFLSLSACIPEPSSFHHSSVHHASARSLLSPRISYATCRFNVSCMVAAVVPPSSCAVKSDNNVCDVANINIWFAIALKWFERISKFETRMRNM